MIDINNSPVLFVMFWVFPFPQIAVFFYYVLLKILIINPQIIFKFAIYKRDITLSDFFTLLSVKEEKDLSYFFAKDRDLGKFIQGAFDSFSDATDAVVGFFLFVIIYPVSLAIITVFLFINLTFALEFLISPFVYVYKKLFLSEKSFMNKTFLKRKKHRNL